MPPSSRKPTPISRSAPSADARSPPPGPFPGNRPDPSRGPIAVPEGAAVPDSFLSAAPLSLDDPDGGRRLARLVARLGPEDSLTIVGALCDFWYAARQYQADP